MENKQVTEKRRPDFSNEFVAVWKKVDKNGNNYLAVKIFGQYFNLFAVKSKNATLQVAPEVSQ